MIGLTGQLTYQTEGTDQKCASGAEDTDIAALSHTRTAADAWYHAGLLHWLGGGFDWCTSTE